MATLILIHSVQSLPKLDAISGKTRHTAGSSATLDPLPHPPLGTGIEAARELLEREVE